MTAPSLADALIDFGKGGDARPPASPFPIDADGTPAATVPGDRHESAVDVDALVADAVASAEAALTQRLTEEADRALAAERDRHAAELSHLQQQLGEAAGADIARQFSDVEDRLVALTTSTAARLLGPILSADILGKTIDELAGVIREAMRDSEAVRIHVRGPSSLCSALGEAAGALARSIEFAETEDYDLSMSIDDNLYETRLGEWSSAISEAVA